MCNNRQKNPLLKLKIKKLKKKKQTNFALLTKAFAIVLPCLYECVYI